MINDNNEFLKAKLENEPLFIRCAKDSGFERICSTTSDQDMCLHADAIGIFNKKITLVDVKHVSKKNIASKKYSISNDLKNFIDNNDLDENHMLAFRLSNGKTLVNEFICAYTDEIFSNCTLIEMNSKNHFTYWLVDINDIKKHCKCICCKMHE